MKVLYWLIGLFLLVALLSPAVWAEDEPPPPPEEEPWDFEDEGEVRGPPMGPGMEPGFKGREGRKRFKKMRERFRARFGCGEREFGRRRGGGEFQPGAFRQGMMLRPEQEEEVKEFIKEWDPRRLEELEEIQYENPMAYAAVLRKAIRKKRQLEKIKKKDPEAYEEMRKEKELEGKVYEKIKLYKEAKDEKEKESLSSEIKDLLDQQFDTKMKVHERHIARIESELTELKSKLKRRRDGKQFMIDRRFKDVTGQEDDLTW